MSLEDSTHSCKWALCDLSTLAPPSAANHDCPKTVFGKSCAVNYLHAISGTAALIALAGGQYFTCEAHTGFIGDHLLNGSLSVSDCASWVMGESCAVTCTEAYQAANETSGTLMWAYDEVAGGVVLVVAVPKCLSVVCSLDDPSTGVRHEFRDFSYQGSCGHLRRRVMKLVGIFQQLSRFVFRRGNSSARHKLSISCVPSRCVLSTPLHRPALA